MNKRSPQAQNNETSPAPRSRLLDLWLGTCARYTVITLLALLISAILHDSMTHTYVDAGRFFLFLPFSCALTLAAWVRRSSALSGGARLALHPALALGGFYLCLYLPYQIETKPSGQQILLILLLAAIVYLTVMGVYLLCTRRSRQKSINDTPYTSQFGKK